MERAATVIHPTPPAAAPAVTVSTLQAFSAAWNRHDVCALMAFMHPACVFYTVAGPDTFGTCHSGPQAVAKAFAAAWAAFPDARWLHDQHFVAGNSGVSQWTFCGTAADGSRIEADGVDVFTFQDGKILVKNAFRKDRPRLPAGAPA
jgi:ketosteroid isomerase-like protein